MDCGVFYRHYAMDFDHVRGDKVDDLSGMVIRTFSFEAIDEEIRKCEIVCSNCHRARTYKRRHGIKLETKNSKVDENMCPVTGQKHAPDGGREILTVVTERGRRRRNVRGRSTIREAR